MKRGDILVARQPGSFASKARPCLIVQSDLALPARSVVTICPLSSTLQGTSLIRISIVPTAENGLVRASEIEIDYIQAIAVGNFGRVIGTASPAVIADVDEALRRWLDL